MRDATVPADVEAEFAVLERAVLYCKQLKISCKNPKEWNAWHTVVRYLMVTTLIKNAARTGVMENMLLKEVENADRIRGE